MTLPEQEQPLEKQLTAVGFNCSPVSELVNHLAREFERDIQPRTARSVFEPYEPPRDALYYNLHTFRGRMAVAIVTPMGQSGLYAGQIMSFIIPVKPEDAEHAQISLSGLDWITTTTRNSYQIQGSRPVYWTVVPTDAQTIKSNTQEVVAGDLVQLLEKTVAATVSKRGNYFSLEYSALEFYVTAPESPTSQGVIVGWFAADKMLRVQNKDGTLETIPPDEIVNFSCGLNVALLVKALQKEIP